MNAFGIDWGRLFTFVSLFEQGKRQNLLSVDDGRRKRIAHAVERTRKLWGSEAVALAPESFDVSDVGEAAWWQPSQKSAFFWKCLAKRLETYCGGFAAAINYETRIAVQALADSPRLTEVAQMAQDVGLPNVQAVSATDALLARWLGEERPSEECHVAAVVVGDTATLLTLMRLRPADSGSVRIHRTLQTSLPYGAWSWATHLRYLVNQRMHESLPATWEIAWQDALQEFGLRLSEASETQEVLWNGPGRDRSYAPFTLTPRQCSEWETVRGFQSDLRVALGSHPRPNWVLLGGLGAEWPFARNVARTLALCWQTTSPNTAIAEGAALLPSLALTFVTASDAWPIEQTTALVTPFEVAAYPPVEPMGNMFSLDPTLSPDDHPVVLPFPDETVVLDPLPKPTKEIL